MMHVRLLTFLRSTLTLAMYHGYGRLTPYLEVAL